MVSTTPSDSTDVPTVTVIIPVYNDVVRLRRCLDLLGRQDYPADRYEVVVVDNASTQDLRPAVPTGDSRFRLTHEGVRGSYAARNTGVAAARGEVLAFTDGDCLPRTDWLRRGIGALTGPDRPDAVGGDINLFFRRGATPTTGPELYETVEGFDQRRFVEEWGFAATANLFVTAERFRLVGDFAPHLQSGGDLEWGTRLKASGGRLAFAADAVVDHPSRPTWRDLTRKSIRIARGLADLTAGDTTTAIVQQIGRDVRSSVAVWVRIWSAPWPPRVTSKVRFAAARSWAGLLRAAVRTDSLVRRSPARLPRRGRT